MPISNVQRAVEVTAFVDWNSQIRLRPQRTRAASETTTAEQTLAYVARILSTYLSRNGENKRFDVTLRVYHGWRKGFEDTPRRKALISTVAGADFISLTPHRSISIRPSIEFGDNLISGLGQRLHSRIQCHLPNTLRRAIDDPEIWEEKMVDTAIASDVVDLAHRERSRWLIVIGDDDDLVPPVYVAEGIRNNSDGKVALIRTRPDTPFLLLNGISFRP